MRIMMRMLLAALICAPVFADGKAVYDKACRSCHGPEGAGNAAIAKVMKVELKHLGSKEVQAKSDAELKKDITGGVGKMKAVTSVTGKDLDEVIAYVRTLKK